MRCWTRKPLGLTDERILLYDETNKVIAIIPFHQHTDISESVRIADDILRAINAYYFSGEDENDPG